MRGSLLNNNGSFLCGSGFGNSFGCFCNYFCGCFFKNRNLLFFVLSLFAKCLGNILGLFFFCGSVCGSGVVY